MRNIEENTDARVVAWREKPEQNTEADSAEV